MSTLRFIAASPAERRKALRLSLAAPDQSWAERDRSVNSFLEYAEQLRLDANRHWFAVRGDEAVAACSCLESPGRTAMLFLGVHPGSPADDGLICDLVRHVVAEEATRNIRLVQALLIPEDRANYDSLTRGGFHQLAELQYMEVRVDPAPSNAAAQGGNDDHGLEWHTYAPDRHAAFAQLVLATYEGSLDCRGLAGLRPIDETLTGHKAAGRFKPHRWLLLSSSRRPVGCILLGENPLRPALDIVYTGVHPAWRHQGFGRRLLERAFALARTERFEALTLAVDAVNAPARSLYESLGFEHTFTRRAMLRVLDSRPPCA